MKFVNSGAEDLSARDGPAAPVTGIVAWLQEPERGSMRFERLGQRFERVEVTVASSMEEAESALENAEVLITIGAHLGAAAGDVYRRARRLKWVQSFGTGVDNIMGHPDLPPGVAVTNIHGVHGPQVSEAAFAAMLCFARKVPETLRNQQKAHWKKLTCGLLSGKTVGVLGLGAIANDLAPRCRSFGMRVVGFTATPRAVPGFDTVFATAELEQAVVGLDYLVVLTPHTEATRHMINAGVLRAMQPGAVLVNLARGGVVDERDLLRALDEDWIAGAALDVFENEPLPDDSPFWSHPKVIVTPHSAGFHSGYPEQAYAAVAANLERYLSGGVAALENRT